MIDERRIGIADPLLTSFFLPSFLISKLPPSLPKDVIPSPSQEPEGDGDDEDNEDVDSQGGYYKDAGDGKGGDAFPPRWWKAPSPFSASMLELTPKGIKDKRNSLTKPPRWKPRSACSEEGLDLKDILRNKALNPVRPAFVGVTIMVMEKCHRCRFWCLPFDRCLEPLYVDKRVPSVFGNRVLLLR